MSKLFAPLHIGPLHLRNRIIIAPMCQYAADSPRAGDVAVIQSYPAGTDKDGRPYPAGDPAGHIAMFDGTKWVSDFKQPDMWGGPGYRAVQPNYEIFRSAP